MRAYDVAFCCAGLLFRRERLDEILSILPEGRREAIRECLKEISGWPESELTERLKTSRQTDVAEAMRRCGRGGASQLESLPAPLSRWLYAQVWESDGREDH